MKSCAVEYWYPASGKKLEKVITFWTMMNQLYYDESFLLNDVEYDDT